MALEVPWMESGAARSAGRLAAAAVDKNAEGADDSAAAAAAAEGLGDIVEQSSSSVWPVVSLAL